MVGVRYIKMQCFESCYVITILIKVKAVKVLHFDSTKFSSDSIKIPNKLCKEVERQTFQTTKLAYVTCYEFSQDLVYIIFYATQIINQRGEPF